MFIFGENLEPLKVLLWFKHVVGGRTLHMPYSPHIQDQTPIHYVCTQTKHHVHHIRHSVDIVMV